MKNFMSRYFSIAFLFVVAASFVACNYTNKENEAEPQPQDSIKLTPNDFVFIGPDSGATLPFEIDSIKTVSQLLDSLAAVK